jgi:hypothetical protein
LEIFLLFYFKGPSSQVSKPTLPPKWSFINTLKKFINFNFLSAAKLALRPQKVKVFKAITVELHCLRPVSGFAAPEFHHSVVFVPNEFRVGGARVVHARQLEANSTAVPDKV